MAETYYDRLDVTEDATTAEIKQAYRDQLVETHPDVSDDPSATDRTKGLIEAKEVLTDDRARARYDRLGHDAYVDQHETDVADVSSSASSAGRAASESTTGERYEWWTTDESDTPGQADTRSEQGTDPSQQRTAREPGRDASGWVSDDGVYAQRWRTDDRDSYRVYTADRSGMGSRLFRSGESLLLLATAWVLYPVMLWASVEPAFPLPVNLVVGGCVLLVVGFLLSMPAVGTAVFGFWSVVLPAVLVAGFGVDLASVVGLGVVSATVLPLFVAVTATIALRA